MLKKIKLPLIHFDQPFHPVILYEILIRIVMNINKISKIAYWLSSKRGGGGFDPHLGHHFVSLSKTHLLRKMY